MADQSVALLAVDMLSLGGYWVPQNSTQTDSWDVAEFIKANGDYEKFSDQFNKVMNVNIVYKFNADTGLGAALPFLGSVHNTWLITEIKIESVWNDYPTITYQCHQHGANVHTDNRNKYSVSIPDKFTGAMGAYDLGGNSADEDCIQSSVYTASLNHIDANCGEGDHWVGQNIMAREEITDNYIGHVDAAVALSSDWKIIGAEYSDSNQEFDTSSITQIHPLTRNS